MWEVYFETLLIMLLMGTATWLLSLRLKNVGIVDSVWSLFFLLAGAYTLYASPVVSSAGWLLFSVLLLWALRLSVFLTWRNWGEPEDRRYQEIRRNNSPHFEYKSLYLVFVLQALIAWVVYIGLLPGLYGGSVIGLQFYLGIALWLIGFSFETVADYQLYRFRNISRPGEVLESGLWRYSRHPNYFGEFLIWWGYFLMVVSVQTWWVIVAPLVMTLLLLKVSGVGLMEQGITKRRPAYQSYIERTNAFIPGFPKPVNTSLNEGVKQ